MKNKIFRAILFILACEAVGLVGSLFTMPAIAGWYAGLVKAPLNPPNWVFGAVWTLLFATIGIAASLLWEKRKQSASARIALEVFVMQLVLNTLWSVLFFYLREPLAALWEIFALWLAIVWLVVRTWMASKTAAKFLLPYLFWVTFAIYLNYMIVVLNR